MSDLATPADAGGAASGHASAALTTEQIESILADFRNWLRDAPVSLDAPPPAESTDLYSLVAQFTALRQEVNLQTRAVRLQQEQTADTLRSYDQTLQALETAIQRPIVHDESAQVRSLLNALIETADAQQLAAREMARVAQSIATLLEENRQQASGRVRSHPALLGRILGLGRIADEYHVRLDQLEKRLTLDGGLLERIRGVVESAASGLAMGLQRIERTMRQNGLEPIPAVGQAFDPEAMEAVEVASDSNRPAGEVIEELRRGYRGNGRVLRFAQVRIAK